jgi:hypothetical protein
MELDDLLNASINIPRLFSDHRLDHDRVAVADS